MVRRFAWTLAFCWGAMSSFGWDVEHDEVAFLTGEFLPPAIKAHVDRAILVRNSHYPDMGEYSEPGKRRYHTMEELGEKIGSHDLSLLRAQGCKGDAGWLHRPRARAVVMGLLARAFAAEEWNRASFYISVLSHAVSDESALNHPPILQFWRYTRYSDVKYDVRPVEAGGKNIFSFPRDGIVQGLVKRKLKGYGPKTPANTFAESVMAFEIDTVRQSAYAGEKERLIGFGEIGEAREALADLVTMQVKVLVDMVWTAWTFRALDAALPGDEFDKVCAAKQRDRVRQLDPAKQGVFEGLFDPSLDPAKPKGTVGIVCEPYGARAGSESPYCSRLFGAMCGRTLRKNGYAVRGLSHYELARTGFPGPRQVPVVLLFTGGTGYVCADLSDEFAKAAKAYRDHGGKLLLLGGRDSHDLSGFARSMVRRGNREVPVSAKWSKTEAGDALKMAVVVDGVRTPFARNPNTDGFSKPVCPVELKVGNGLEPLAMLDNGCETFCIAGRKGNVVWAPSYLIAPYLFVKDDPKIDLGNAHLDPFGEQTLFFLVRPEFPIF